MSLDATQDAWKTRQDLLEGVVNAVDMFNEMFFDIAPIADSARITARPPACPIGSGSSSSSHDDGLALTRRDLTEAQCQKLQHISGYLRKVKDAGEVLYRLYGRNDSDGTFDPSEELKNLRQELLNQKKEEEKYMKTMVALQDFLVIELNRSEATEARLKEKEDIITTLEEEKKKYFILYCSERDNNAATRRGGAGTGGRGSSAAAMATAAASAAAAAGPTSKLGDVTTTGDKETLAQMAVGKFVRKKFDTRKFFGLIMEFSHPFFKVVYEDGDEEEQTRAEVRKNEWPGKVPDEKLLKCVQNAKNLKMCPAHVAGLDEVLARQDREAKAAAAAASGSWAYAALGRGEGEAEVGGSEVRAVE